MKTKKILKIITIILLIAIISIASIFGIYKLKDYRVKNVIPDYKLGMEFSKIRVINLKIDDRIETTQIYDKDGNEITEKKEGIEYTEENGYTIKENKTNPDEVLTKDNYKKVNSILKNRLVKLGAEQYTIKQDWNNGNIQIQIPENDSSDRIISNVIQKGTFQLIDDETKEVLLDNSNIKSVKVVYGQTETGTTVYLQIKFDDAGKQKLEEISKIYVQTTVQTTNEEGETEDTTETKNVAITLDGETLTTTYFGDTLTDGVLNIGMGSAQNNASLQEYIISAREIATILNSGILPIEYEETDYTLNNEINLLENKYIVYSAIAIIVLVCLYFIIKLKLKGLLAIIFQVGYASLLLLVLRYTNVKITIEGIVGIVLSILFNCIFTYKALKNSDQNFIKDITVKFAIKLIPIYIIAIIFTFNSIANISSLGMTLVWGIITMYLYNLTLTQITVKTIEEK